MAASGLPTKRYPRMAAAWKRLASVDAWLERHKGAFMDSARTTDAGKTGSAGTSGAAGSAALDPTTRLPMSRSAAEARPRVYSAATPVDMGGLV